MFSNVCGQQYGTTSGVAATGLEIKVVNSGTARATILRQPDTKLGTVVQNRVLTALEAPVKRHIGASVTIRRDDA